MCISPACPSVSVAHLHSNLTLKENIALIVSDPAARPHRPPLNHSSIVHTQDKAQGEISLRHRRRQNTNIPQLAANTLLPILE